MWCVHGNLSSYNNVNYSFVLVTFHIHISIYLWITFIHSFFNHFLFYVKHFELARKLGLFLLLLLNDTFRYVYLHTVDVTDSRVKL